MNLKAQLCISLGRRGSRGFGIKPKCIRRSGSLIKIFYAPKFWLLPILDHPRPHR